MSAAGVDCQSPLDEVTRALLGARATSGTWEGELASSGLSTATAICALAMLDAAAGSCEHQTHVERGASWLAEHQNADGGWGDTPDSPTNISTTTLCWAALGRCQGACSGGDDAARRAEAWLRTEAGDVSPASLSAAIHGVYGRDLTFSVPILTMCALAGQFGEGPEAWRHIPSLPFEFAAVPRRWFHRLGLPVVSYAIPALIAIGQARHHHRPTRNLPVRWLRARLRTRTLDLLTRIQPASGGFLEAAPLTSFVTMSLASIGEWNHPVARRGREFLVSTVRPDGSWPIDTNLATWLTTLSIAALADAGRLKSVTTQAERARWREALLARQMKEVHPYTLAAPGGWAWTDLSGGVPDADDTPSALLALHHLSIADEDAQGNEGEGSIAVRRACAAGIEWLLDLQNRDGGIPTFCRGWGRLPFDRSTPDLTAHAIRAWIAWRDQMPSALSDRVTHAMDDAVGFLLKDQAVDGSWVPLWFGNQSAPRQQNPVYGTSRVLRAAEALRTAGVGGRAASGEWITAIDRASQWLLTQQNGDGGWGGAGGTPSSVEETALAVDGLAGIESDELNAKLQTAMARGCQWLTRATAGGTRFPASPIGLYFAKLWYSERLYPMIFTLAALGRAARRFSQS